MLQDMNDRYSYTLAMIGLVKASLTLNTPKQTVSLLSESRHGFSQNTVSFSTTFGLVISDL